MSSENGLGNELESFRQKWISDLRTSRGAEPSASSSSAAPPSSTSAPAPASASASASTSTSTRTTSARKLNAPPSPTTLRKPIWDEGDYMQGYNFDELPASLQPPAEAPSSKEPEQAAAVAPEKKNLVSALDHFEEAMEKEAIGNMGDSLHLYRRAYRMDHTVDKKYREKYFPSGSKAAAAKPHASAAPSTAKADAAPANAPEEPPKPLTIKELLASFASLQITAQVPDVEGEPPLPCPMADLPDELLVHILQDVAADDVAAFARLSRVCKRLAYLVATEQRIWRAACISQTFGFAGMHRRWRSAIEWTPTTSNVADYVDEDDEEHLEGGIVVSPREMAQRDLAESHFTTCSLTPSPYPSWKAMFRHRPRVRFTGCYISTVNYVRSGQASTNQATWGSAPIHIVTYYRYLRFFRDGSLISLLTTAEPGDVVHHLTREQLQVHRGTAQGHLPSAVMHLAHRGRWRMSSPVSSSAPQSTRTKHPNDTGAPSGDSDLYIETEGAGSKYLYRMDLTFRSAGKASATKNNKIVWRAFYSYNKLTDDWGEFGLKNDKPFFFSRVRSYGLGE